MYCNNYYLCTSFSEFSIICLRPPTTAGERHYVRWLSVCPSVRCPLTNLSHDAIFLYLVDRFQWNLAQIFIMWVGSAVKVFVVKGQRSRSQRGQKNVVRDAVSPFVDVSGHYWKSCRRQRSKKDQEGQTPFMRRRRTFRRWLVLLWRPCLGQPVYAQIYIVYQIPYVLFTSYQIVKTRRLSLAYFLIRRKLRLMHLCRSVCGRKYLANKSSHSKTSRF